MKKIMVQNKDTGEIKYLDAEEPYTKPWSPYVSSKEHLQKMRDLAAEHHMGFYFNPGGGEYIHPKYGQCQISTYNDIEDCEKLEQWLAYKEGENHE